MSDLSLMRSNLQAIYSVAHQPINEAPELVANFSGRIYSTADCWGRIWKYIILRVISWFVGNIQERLLKEALLKTHEVFRENLVKIQFYNKQYESYLKQLLSGRPCDEEECGPIRDAITNWNDATRPFLKLIKREGTDHILEIFRHNLGMQPSTPCDFFETTSSKVFSSPPAIAQPGEDEQKAAEEMLVVLPYNFRQEPLFNTAQLDACVNFQRFIDFQGLFPESEPHVLFEALGRLSCTAKSMPADHRRKIEQFIKRLNEMVENQEISIGFLHRFLKGIVENLNEPDADLTQLEVRLIERGCTLFDTDDADQIQRRDNLKKGDVIKFNDNGTIRDIELGDELGAKTDGINRNRIFVEANDKERAILVSNNQVVLNLKNAMRKLYKAGHGKLNAMRIYAVDARGRYAIVERLHRPLLGAIAWRSQDSLDPDDQRGAQGLMEIIKNLLDADETPAFFSPKYLMFDAKNILRCSKIPFKKPLNFVALEDAALALAPKTRAVYKYIIKEAGLTNHRYAKFYRKMFNNALAGTTTPAKDVGARQGKGITDPRVIDRGQALYDAVVTLKETHTEEEIRKHYDGCGMMWIDEDNNFKPDW